jgi:hypothetical protein
MRGVSPFFSRRFEFDRGAAWGTGKRSLPVPAGELTSAIGTGNGTKNPFQTADVSRYLTVVSALALADFAGQCHTVDRLTIAASLV